MEVGRIHSLGRMDLNDCAENAHINRIGGNFVRKAHCPSQTGLPTARRNK